MRSAKDKLMIVSIAACVLQTIGSVNLNLEQLEVSPIIETWQDIINQRLTHTAVIILASWKPPEG